MTKGHIIIALFRHFSLSAIIRSILSSILSSILKSLGLLWLIVEPLSFFFLSFGDNVKPYWWLFLLIGVARGVHCALPKSKAASRIQGTDSFIELHITDMFSVPAAFIIPCNRTFDTSIEDGIISPESTQGQFTQLFFANSRDELDRQICKSIESSERIELDKENKPYGNRIEFPIGTVAEVSSSGKTAYLVAISSLNEHRNATASNENILDALPAIWEFIRTRGEFVPLCCPILGSKFSRVQATREDLTREIIKSFVAACRAGHFCDKLTIAIAPSDFKSGKVNFESLRRFLEHECLYPAALSSDSTSGSTGTPA